MAKIYSSIPTNKTQLHNHAFGNYVVENIEVILPPFPSPPLPFLSFVIPTK
jgi:hypothetical protein